VQLATVGVGLTNYAIALYMLFVYRRQKVRNRSTLLWSLGFFLWAATLTIRFLMERGTPLPVRADLVLGVAAYLNGVAFVLLYLGIARLIFHRRFSRQILPLVLFIILTLGLISTALQPTTQETVLAHWSYAALAPLAFLLAVIFFMLYGVLVAEDSSRNWGGLLLGVGFLIATVQFILLPHAFGSAFDFWWMLTRIAAQASILAGLILLERELRVAVAALDSDRRHAIHLHGSHGREPR
jgi:hypothetical protein